MYKPSSIRQHILLSNGKAVWTLRHLSSTIIIKVNGTWFTTSKTSYKF